MKKLLSTLMVMASLGLGTLGNAYAGAAATAQPVAAPTAGMVTEVGDRQGRWRDYRGDSSRTWHRDGRRDGWRDHRRYGGHYRPGPSFHLHVQPRVAPRYVPRPVYRSSSAAHVAWCHARYRSYRAWDNSWQPYHGPRQLCRSPYN